jgi:hypothetical protein
MDAIGLRPNQSFKMLRNVATANEDERLGTSVSRSIGVQQGRSLDEKRSRRLSSSSGMWGYRSGGRLDESRAGTTLRRAKPQERRRGAESML